MEFHSADQRSYVRLQRQGLSHQSDLGLTLAVQMYAHGFSGQYAEVGVFATDLRRFIATLENLERHRAGKATLQSMSPDEFILTFAIVDRAGHLSVTGELRRHLNVTGQLAVLAVCIAFELDPSLLQGIINDFRQILPPL